MTHDERQNIIEDKRKETKIKQRLNKKVYLTHGETLILLGLLEGRVKHLKEGDWNLVEQFMLNVVFIDIINDSFDKKEETIIGVITT
jgi:hemerythrin-like domain-containing protein